MSTLLLILVFGAAMSVIALVGSVRLCILLALALL